MIANRRSFLLGIGSALAAPAVVRADSLMKLWVPPKPALTAELLLAELCIAHAETLSQSMTDLLVFGSSFTMFDEKGMPRAVSPPDVWNGLYSEQDVARMGVTVADASDGFTAYGHRPA